MATISLHFNSIEGIWKREDPVKFQADSLYEDGSVITVRLRNESEDSDISLFLTPAQYRQLRQEFIDTPVESVVGPDVEVEEDARVPA